MALPWQAYFSQLVDKHDLIAQKEDGRMYLALGWESNDPTSNGGRKKKKRRMRRGYKKYTEGNKDCFNLSGHELIYA